MTAVDIFNTLPAQALERVCTAYARLLAHDDYALIEKWGSEEWALAPQTAFVLGVGALLHARYASDPRWQGLPEAFRPALARQYAMNQQRVERMWGELAQLLAALNELKIPVVPLKGILLSQRYYRDPFTRPMADIDLLVRPDALDRVSGAFQRLGYQTESHPFKPNFVRPDNQYPVCFDGDHPDNPRRIEVHTRLEDEFRGSTIDWTEWAWRTSVLSADGACRRELAPSVLFAHLLSHTTRDMMTCRVRLIQLYDIALVARSLTRDAGWAEFDVPDNPAVTRFMFPALALTRQYFASDIPDSLYQTFARAAPPRLRAWCERQSLWDVSWLGGNHVGVLQTLLLWSLSPGEAARMAGMMWGRRSLHLNHLFPQFQKSGRAWLAYPAYLLDRLGGSPRGKTRRGRWDYSNPPPD